MGGGIAVEMEWYLKFEFFFLLAIFHCKKLVNASQDSYGGLHFI